MLIRVAVHTPNSPAPVEAESYEELLMLAEQLTQQTEQLRQENAALQSQLSSVLEAARTPILNYGEGMGQRSLNARSIKIMFLVEEVVSNSYPPVGSGRWSVMADETHLTDFLNETEALEEFTKARGAWITALEPPSSSQ